MGLYPSRIERPTLHRIRCRSRARLAQHLRGHTHTTKRLGENIEVVASKQVATLREARGIERTLKAKKNPQLAICHLQQLARESYSE